VRHPELRPASTRSSRQPNLLPEFRFSSRAPLPLCPVPQPTATNGVPGWANQRKMGQSGPTHRRNFRISDRHVWGLKSQRGLWYFPATSKRPFIIPIPQAYRRFVREGEGLSRPWDKVQHQLLLGDDAFVAQYKHQKHPEELRDVSKAQRRSMTLSLHEYQQGSRGRKEAMTQAYLSGAYTIAEIGIILASTI